MTSPAELIHQAEEAGVRLEFVGGQVLVSGRRSAVAPFIEPLRQHKETLIKWFTAAPANDTEPRADPGTWRELHIAYMEHQFRCATCIAAGQGRGLRCGTGASLWSMYCDPSAAKPHSSRTSPEK